MIFPGWRSVTISLFVLLLLLLVAGRCNNNIVLLYVYFIHYTLNRVTDAHFSLTPCFVVCYKPS